MTDLKEQAKQFALMGKGQFLKTFACVPEDRITWSPAPTAKSALRLAAHVGIANLGIAAVVRGEGIGAATMQEVLAQSEAAERTITTRQQALDLIENSVQAVLAALDALTPERIAGVVETPMLTAPMPVFMNLFGLHMFEHASQVDYLQTIWGDMEFHM